MTDKPSIRVMLVEDDPLLSDLLARKFTSENIDLLYAGTGEIALDLLQKDALPDLIMLDIRLPGIDGFGVLEQVRTNEATKHIPVVIFSNFGEDADRKRAEELGANEFIVKVSLSLDEVVSLVRASAKK